MAEHSLIDEAARAVLCTPPGRGAVAVIRMRGPALLLSAGFVPAGGQALAALPAGRILFGRWGAGAGEDVVVIKLDDACWEVHCHGGRAAVDRILRDLAEQGCPSGPSWELVARESSRLDAELAETLTRAVTLRTAGLLLAQTGDAWRRVVAGWAEQRAAHEGREAVGKEIAELLRWGGFGRHLTEPWQVVLTGRPNVGKSSLLNALAGYERAIVSPVPGTTRDVVGSDAAFDGWPVRLTDTAGVRGGATGLEAAGIARAEAALKSADLVVRVVDLSQPEELTDRPEELLVGNKADLPRSASASWPDGLLRVSAHTGAGVPELIAAISARLVPQTPPPGRLVPATPRQAEALRALSAAVGEDGPWNQAVQELLGCP